MIRVDAFRLVILGIILCSCTPDQRKKNKLGASTGRKEFSPSFVVNQPKDIAPKVTDSAMLAEQYADYFIVVIDTGFNYSALRTQMFRLSNELGIAIDTLGRTFYEKKNLIALPEDDEDEIYAGDYFPRRDLGENLSLEYLDFYQQDASKKRIALVSGIYEDKKSADSALKIIKTIAPKAFSFKANIYIGCMH